MLERGEFGLNIEVEERDDVVIVKPMGHVVRDNQAELRAELERLVRGGASKIALNLEMVDYMDMPAWDAVRSLASC